MTYYYYRIDLDEDVFQYEDVFKWNIYDKEEMEYLFIELGHHHYGFDPEAWNKQHYHDIIVCTKDGLPMRGMTVEMHLEPTFVAHEKYPQVD